MEETESVVNIVELDVYAREHGKEAPKAKQYAFRVDKLRIVVSTPTITGTQILAEAGKTPETFKLYQHKRGHQPIPIGPNDIVNLREPGVERFTTMPKDTTEGRNGPLPSRDFNLPAADEQYLNSLGLPWETVLDGQTQWVIIHEWLLPTGYNTEKTSVALLIPNNYADSQIDMVYFKVHLARYDGKGISSLSTQLIAGEEWQRWSRHRTGQNPWRPGIDDIASHLSLVDEWLRREFIKAVA
jgi:hypothetical protein